MWLETPGAALGLLPAAQVGSILLLQSCGGRAGGLKGVTLWGGPSHGAQPGPKIGFGG